MVNFPGLCLLWFCHYIYPSLFVILDLFLIEPLWIQFCYLFSNSHSRLKGQQFHSGPLRTLFAYQN